MAHVKAGTIVVERNGVKVLIFIFLLALLILMPGLINIQWITGPTVNAALFIAVVMVGPTQAMLLGLMPSSVALLSGLLPLPLAPMVPFIMIGNALLVVAFNYYYRKNFLIAVGIAAFVKFAFLYATVTWLMSSVLQEQIVAQLSIMMSWPQFLTAVIGGFVAYGFLKSIKKV